MRRKRGIAESLPVDLKGIISHIMLAKHQNAISVLLTVSRVPEAHKAQDGRLCTFRVNSLLKRLRTSDDLSTSLSIRPHSSVCPSLFQVLSFFPGESFSITSR